MVVEYPTRGAVRPDMAGRKAGQIIEKGKDTWLVRVDMGRDIKGKRLRFSKTVKGKRKDAQAVLNRMLKNKDDNRLLEPTRDTLGDFLDKWLEVAAKPRLRPTTYQDYENLLKYYIRPELGECKLQKLTTLDIQKVYTGMHTRGLSPRTVQYTHRVLNNALKQAVIWRMLPFNPAEGTKLPKQARKEMLYMSDEESRRFLDAARLSPHFALFSLLLATGLRPSEALALKWSDIDFKAHRLSITRTVRRFKGAWLFEEPKTKRSRRVVDFSASLSDVLLKYRAQQLGTHELVFCNLDGEPLHERTLLDGVFRPLLKTVKLDPAMRLYDLRHTHATLMLLAGVHPKVVSERLGHSSITITLDTYTHVLPTLQRESADKLGFLLFDQPETQPARAVN